MSLHEVNVDIEKHKKRKRIGRGIGSGHGKTSTRGHKGQGQRNGYSRHPAFQGGMMPMVRRIPKRGFFNSFALKVAATNVGNLESAFEAGAVVGPEELRAFGLVSGIYDIVKVLGDGELTKKLTVKAHRFSESAKQKIEAAGGTVEVLVHRVPVEEKKAAARAAKSESEKAKKNGG